MRARHEVALVGAAGEMSFNDRPNRLRCFGASLPLGLDGSFKFAAATRGIALLAIDWRAGCIWPGSLGVPMTSMASLTPISTDCLTPSRIHPKRPVLFIEPSLHCVPVSSSRCSAIRNLANRTATIPDQLLRRHAVHDQLSRERHATMPATIPHTDSWNRSTENLGTRVSDWPRPTHVFALGP